MRVCVIGNSHVGMLIKSLAETPQDDLTCHFFAAPGAGPDVFAITPAGVLSTDDPALVKQFATFRMSTAVDLAACDLIVVVAMMASLFQIKPLLGDHVIHGWPGSRAALRNGKSGLLSEPALCAGLVERIRAGLSYRYVTAIRAVQSTPILVVREPAPSATLLDVPGKHPFLKRAAASGDALACQAVLTRAHLAAFAGTDNLTILDQPAQTLTPQGLTEHGFTAGAVRLDTRFAQPGSDVLHANATYGSLIWAQIRTAAAAQLP